MPFLPLDFFDQPSTSGRRIQGREVLLMQLRLPADGRFACAKNTSVLLAFRNGTTGQPDLGEHCRIVAERLVHVWNDFHDLAEQGAFAVVHDLGHEIRSDGWPVLFMSDL